MRGHGAKDIGQQDLLRARLDAQINMNGELCTTRDRVQKMAIFVPS